MQRQNTREEKFVITNCLDNNTGGHRLPQKKNTTLPVIIVPEDLREEATKPDGAQASFPVSFSNFFSKLNHWCHEQMRIQKSEPLQKLLSVSS